MQDFSRWEAHDGNEHAFAALRERAVSAFLRLRALEDDTRKALRSVALKVRASPYDLPWGEAVEELSRDRDRMYTKRYARFQPKSVDRFFDPLQSDDDVQSATFAWEATLWLRAFDFFSEGAFARSRMKRDGKAPSDVLEVAFDFLAVGEPEAACLRFLKLTDLAKKDVVFSSDSSLLLWFLVGLSGMLASLEGRVPTSWEKRLLGATHRLVPEDPLSCVAGFLLKGVNPYFDEQAHRRIFCSVVESPGVKGFASRRPHGEGDPFALHDLVVCVAARALGLKRSVPPFVHAQKNVFRWLKSLADVSLAEPSERPVFGCFGVFQEEAPPWLRMAQKVEETLGLRETGTTARAKAKPKEAEAAQKPRLVWRVQVQETGLCVLVFEQAFVRGKPLPLKAIPMQRLTHERGRQAYSLEPGDVELLGFIQHGVPLSGWSHAGHREWHLAWHEALPSLARHKGLTCSAPGGARPLRVSLARPVVAASRRAGRIVFEIVAIGASQGWCWWWRSPTELAVAELGAQARAGFDLLRTLEIPESDANDERLGAFLGRLSSFFDIAFQDTGLGGLVVQEVKRPLVVRIDPSVRTTEASFFVSTSVRVPGSLPGLEGRVAPGAMPASFLVTSEQGVSWCTRDLGWEESLLEELKSFLNANGAHDDAEDDAEDNLGDDEHSASESFAALLPSWNDLAALLSFLATRSDAFEVEWPDAQKPLVSLLDSVTFALPDSAAGNGGVGAWFQPGEKTKLELEARGLSLSSLIERVKATKNRFVVLEGGGILALSEKVHALVQDLGLVAAAEKPAAFAFSQAHAGSFPDVKAFESALFENVLQGECLGDLSELPWALAQTLRGYQREGIEWILWRWRRGLGCCLADDMGLGKTLQAIGALELVKAQGRSSLPALVVCPTSVVGNWARELARFGKKRVPFVFPPQGRDGRESFLELLPAEAVVLVSYQTLQMNAAAFAAREWSALVLDEAQMLKNADTKRTAAVAGLRATFKIALSGTPVENRIEEIHSLLNILNPGMFGSATSFRRKFGGGQSADVAAGERKALARLLRPFLLRRTREAVLTDLPERVEETRLLAMTDAERIRYESYREGALRFLETSSLRARDRLEVFSWLLRLRQACSHPRNLEKGTLERSAKEQELALLLAENREAGLQTLVFSQFLPTLHSLHALAQEEGYVSFLFVGETSRAERDALIERFQEGEADVMFMSLRAGGVGVNLTRADCVVHYDPWWNPALESQATARAHRFGRRGAVRVVRLCYSDSVEERMLELHANKRALSEDLLGGKASGAQSASSEESGLSLEDLRALFADA